MVVLNRIFFWRSLTPPNFHKTRESFVEIEGSADPLNFHNKILWTNCCFFFCCGCWIPMRGQLTPPKTGNDIFRRLRPFPVFVVDDTSEILFSSVSSVCRRTHTRNFFFTFFPIFFRVVRKKYNYFYNNKLTTSDINHLPTKILTFPITSWQVVYVNQRQLPLIYIYIRRI